MLFNSLAFLLFFPVVTALYFLLPHKFRWILLLTASCVFYMSFIPVYIFILFFTIIVDYIAGIFIENAIGKKRRLFLVMSLVSNIGVLAFFKYYNFFIDNFNALFRITSIPQQWPLLNILLPIGLSFHTFQAMSYTIEVYRGNQPAEKHFGIYALYVMFYPQLVAGPIERPQNLLPQFKEKHPFNWDNLVSGLRLMVWGFFKKLVIADRLSIYVDEVYNNHARYSPFMLIIAMVFFAFQIYCDFSGYSDIAIGAARTMGFELMTNFTRPFKSKSITEFWRRWHISLSTWFNDYLYTPIVIAKRDWGKLGIAFGLLFTFFISGFWHGANWGFVIYGVLNGIACMIEFFTMKARKRLAKKIPAVIYTPFYQLLTFAFLSFSWLFFRAPKGVINTLHIIKKAFGDFGRGYFDISFKGNILYYSLPLCFILILGMLTFEKFTKVDWYKQSKYSLLFFVPVLTLILYLGVFAANSFIYFQF